MSLRIGDRSFQPKELSDNTLMKMYDTQPKTYKHWLALQVTSEHSIDSVDRIKPVEKIT